MVASESLAAIVRICTYCEIEKPATLDFYPPHKLGKYGLHSWCRICKKKIDAARRKRPDQQERQQAWRDANKDYVKRYNDEYRKTHKSTEYVAAWRKKNIDKARLRESAAVRRRRATDPAYLLKTRISGRLSRMLGGKASRTTEQLLGYTAKQLRDHIERQFTRGMSWDRVRNGEIEIDHILPVKMFGAITVDDPGFRVCWGLPNLRPMWSGENRAKGARRLTIL